MACSPAGLFLLRCRIGILRWLANPLTTVITAAVDAFNVFAVTEAIGELSSSDGNELGFRLLIAAALFTGLGFLSAIAGGVVSHISVDGIAACFAVAATFNFPADGIASLSNPDSNVALLQISRAALLVQFAETVLLFRRHTFMSALRLNLAALDDAVHASAGLPPDPQGTKLARIPPPSMTSIIRKALQRTLRTMVAVLIVLQTVGPVLLSRSGLQGAQVDLLVTAAIMALLVLGMYHTVRYSLRHRLIRPVVDLADMIEQLGQKHNHGDANGVGGATGRRGSSGTVVSALRRRSSVAFNWVSRRFSTTGRRQSVGMGSSMGPPALKRLDSEIQSLPHLIVGLLPPRARVGLARGLNFISCGFYTRWRVGRARVAPQHTTIGANDFNTAAAAAFGMEKSSAASSATASSASGNRLMNAICNSGDCGINGLVNRLLCLNQLQAGLDDNAKQRQSSGVRETEILRAYIHRISRLVRMGFGEAGQGIVGRFIQLDGEMRDAARGEKVHAVFGFCDVRNFTDITECLQEDVLTFVNDVARIVHTEVHRSGGAPNKNIGDAFLLVWKLPSKPIDNHLDGLRALRRAGSTTALVRKPGQHGHDGGTKRYNSGPNEPDAEADSYGDPTSGRSSRGTSRHNNANTISSNAHSSNGNVLSGQGSDRTNHTSSAGSLHSKGSGKGTGNGRGITGWLNSLRSSLPRLDQSFAMSSSNALVHRGSQHTNRQGTALGSAMSIDTAGTGGSAYKDKDEGSSSSAAEAITSTSVRGPGAIGSALSRSAQPVVHRPGMSLTAPVMARVISTMSTDFQSSSNANGTGVGRQTSDGGRSDYQAGADDHDHDHDHEHTSPVESLHMSSEWGTILPATSTVRKGKTGSGSHEGSGSNKDKADGSSAALGSPGSAGSEGSAASAALAWSPGRSTATATATVGFSPEQQPPHHYLQPITSSGAGSPETDLAAPLQLDPTDGGGSGRDVAARLSASARLTGASSANSAAPQALQQQLQPPYPLRPLSITGQPGSGNRARLNTITTDGRSQSADGTPIYRNSEEGAGAGAAGASGASDDEEMERQRSLGGSGTSAIFYSRTPALPLHAPTADPSFDLSVQQRSNVVLAPALRPKKSVAALEMAIEIASARLNAHASSSGRGGQLGTLQQLGSQHTSQKSRVGYVSPTTTVVSGGGAGSLADHEHDGDLQLDRSRVVMPPGQIASPAEHTSGDANVSGVGHASGMRGGEGNLSGMHSVVHVVSVDEEVESPSSAQEAPVPAILNSGTGSGSGAVAASSPAPAQAPARTSPAIAVAVAPAPSPLPLGPAKPLTSPQDLVDRTASLTASQLPPASSSSASGGAGRAPTPSASSSASGAPRLLAASRGARSSLGVSPGLALSPSFQQLADDIGATVVLQADSQETMGGSSSSRMDDGSGRGGVEARIPAPAPASSQPVTGDARRSDAPRAGVNTRESSAKDGDVGVGIGILNLGFGGSANSTSTLDPSAISGASAGPSKGTPMSSATADMTSARSTHQSSNSGGTSQNESVHTTRFSATDTARPHLDLPSTPSDTKAGDAAANSSSSSSGGGAVSVGVQLLPTIFSGTSTLVEGGSGGSGSISSKAGLSEMDAGRLKTRLSKGLSPRRFSTGGDYQSPAKLPTPVHAVSERTINAENSISIAVGLDLGNESQRGVGSPRFTASGNVSTSGIIGLSSPAGYSTGQGSLGLPYSNLYQHQPQRGLTPVNYASIAAAQRNHPGNARMMAGVSPNPSATANAMHLAMSAKYDVHAAGHFSQLQGGLNNISANSMSTASIGGPGGGGPILASAYRRASQRMYTAGAAGTVTIDMSELRSELKREVSGTVNAGSHNAREGMAAALRAGSVMSASSGPGSMTSSGAFGRHLSYGVNNAAHPSSIAHDGNSSTPLIKLPSGIGVGLDATRRRLSVHVIGADGRNLDNDDGFGSASSAPNGSSTGKAASIGNSSNNNVNNSSMTNLMTQVNVSDTSAGSRPSTTTHAAMVAAAQAGLTLYAAGSMHVTPVGASPGTANTSFTVPPNQYIHNQPHPREAHNQAAAEAHAAIIQYQQQHNPYQLQQQYAPVVNPPLVLSTNSGRVLSVRSIVTEANTGINGGTGGFHHHHYHTPGGASSDGNKYRQLHGVSILANNSLASFLNVICKVYDANLPGGSLAKYRRRIVDSGMVSSTSGDPDAFRVRMGFGLHIGWAIEGAIGSSIKIDASYLSPSVNVAARLESATKFYGVEILISKAFAQCLSFEAVSLLRRVDRVKLKGVAEPMELYTFDWDEGAARRLLHGDAGDRFDSDGVAGASLLFNNVPRNNKAGSPQGLSGINGNSGVYGNSGIFPYGQPSMNNNQQQSNQGGGFGGFLKSSPPDTVTTPYQAFFRNPNNNQPQTTPFDASQQRVHGLGSATPHTPGQGRLEFGMPGGRPSRMANANSVTPAATPGIDTGTSSGGGGPRPLQRDMLSNSLGPDATYGLPSPTARMMVEAGRIGEGTHISSQRTLNGIRYVAASSSRKAKMLELPGGRLMRPEKPPQANGNNSAATVPTVSLADAVHSRADAAESANGPAHAAGATTPAAHSDPHKGNGSIATAARAAAATAASAADQIIDMTSLQPETVFSPAFIRYSELAVDFYLGDADAGVPADWDMARQCAAAALELRPTDGPLAALIGVLESLGERDLNTGELRAPAGWAGYRILDAK